MLTVLLTLAILASGDEVPWVPENCMEKTTLELDGKEVTFTVDDVKTIEKAVNHYLRVKKPKIDEAAFPVKDAFIDCWGAIRMNGWVLEAHDKDLRLAFRIINNEHLIVREEITLQQVRGKWKAVSNGEVIYHGARER